MDKFYTVKEVAGILGLNRKTITNYINHEDPKQRLKAKWFGNRWRIYPDDLQEFIKGEEANNDKG